MGIDRGDVRCVIHAACPKSVEHYQQETGRAGRDGLEAECVLLHSGSDAQKWRMLIQRSVDEALDRGVEVDPAWLEAQHELLRAMERIATTLVCRHKALSEYFGQAYEPPEGREGTPGQSGRVGDPGGCGACDVCLGEVAAMDDGTVVAQKILSCVARVGQRFGASHVAGVLVGEDSERIRRQGHERLSTFGLLRGHTKRAVAGLIEQLLGLGVLERVGGEYPVLRLNEASMEVLKGSRPVRLAEAGGRGKAKRADVERQTWEGVDRGLFEALRSLRKGLAEERGVPPYVIFGDATLRELARVRPGSLERMRGIHGIGERKLADLGEVFLEAVRSYAGEQGLELDVGGSAAAQSRGHGTDKETSADGPVPESRAPVFALFDQGLGIEEVARRAERSEGAVAQMLVEYIKRCAPDSLGAWVDPRTYELVRGAVEEHGLLSPKQLHEVIGEGATYEQVRWVRAHLAARG
jgi:ATP-dependent DNA helicase RecQ